MSQYALDRLSAQDFSFLAAERENTPMHVGALAIFETGPLRSKSGSFDMATYASTVESVLHRIPRYRQKLAWIPVDRWPVWVDDHHFDLGNHVRQLSLPRPGTLDQLKEMAGRILARPLDRARPLWEIWVIDGLEDGEQFALLNKIHHCMMDGVAGVDLSQILFSDSPTHKAEAPRPYLPRTEPAPGEMFEDAVRARIARPVGVLRSAQSWFRNEKSNLLDEVGKRASAVADLAGWSLRPISETPINGDLSRNRKIDWLTMPLDDVRELRRVLGCTVNDIVLATVTGALRTYLQRRHTDLDKLDFRIAVPVNVRREEHENQLGNHVSSWILRLPLEEPDPVERVSQVGMRTTELKKTNAALGIETIMDAAEWLPAGLIERGAGLVSGQVNMVVTNVPGPQFPLYTAGARLLGLYPLVPLIPGTGLGVALFSYEGKLCWGFNADAELVHDVRFFAADLCSSFEVLRAATVSRYMQQRTAEAELRRRSPPRRRSSAGARASCPVPDGSFVEAEHITPR